ncbi:MAG: NAD-dependent deacylase [Planctomycetaceae bacterium]|nr:NAD-dependent deacylase [Planctomycetales bacterium]MCB9875560.1 NAD-dependent deacylase [Planctomycetaceae bacterium]MCB9938307.1 NAD-dependent deacylase [Planctomycetaceae bacterium]HRX79355.1 NAD-dependent deacylase [Pirellulaceae bacterium]
MDSESCQLVAQWLAASRRAVAFTGAGVSTESGIPDFRSPGGVWATSQPVYFDDFLRSTEARYEYWRQKSVLHRDFANATPNSGHQVLARWGRIDKLKAVVTQNIDGLHQIAGSEHVLELHGTARYVACLSCQHRVEAGEMVERFLELDCPPDCPECGGFMKHATVSFGQSLPADVLQESIEFAEQADLFLAIGSSLVVHPAASLPMLAKRSGARLVIINRDSTSQDDAADVVMNASIGDTLLAIDEHLKGFEYKR